LLQFFVNSTNVVIARAAGLAQQHALQCCSYGPLVLLWQVLQLQWFLADMMSVPKLPSSIDDISLLICSVGRFVVACCLLRGPLQPVQKPVAAAEAGI
jgi:hypothetical protein